MTASPIDANTDLEVAARDLENLLHCKIATASDMSLVESVHKPTEQVLRYGALKRSGHETPFLTELRRRYGDLHAFEEIFIKASEIVTELGRWCADEYLRTAISSERQQKLLIRVRKSLSSRNGNSDTPQLDVAAKRIREAIEYASEEGTRVNSRNMSDLELALNNAGYGETGLISALDGSDIVSSKVAKLHYFLAKEFERATEYRCIVFVEWKQTARLLHYLFQHLNTRNLRHDFVIGSGSAGELVDGKFSFRSQVLSLHKFRNGTVNCLFATSVAEEGLDVPNCNLVIRFDLYKTMIQYVQSRGRARKRNSKFMHMVEDGNNVQAHLVRDALISEKLMRSFCGSLPADRQLRGNDDIELLTENELHSEVKVIESTGAKLTFGNSMPVLARFVSAIPQENREQMLYATYVVEHQGVQFVAEVILPANAPVQSFFGKPQNRKNLAKRSAAFEACLDLLRKAYLDEHMLPIYQKKLPLMRNAALATGMNKSNHYPMRAKPRIWAETRGTIPTELWVTVVDFVDGALERPHQPLLFLTRTALPTFPRFPLYLTDGRPITVATAHVNDRGPIHVTDELLYQFTKFTLCIFNDVFSKEYQEEPEKMSYWLGPASSGVGIFECKVVTPEQAIDYETLNHVASNPEGFSWTSSMPDAELVDRFFTDPGDGGRKYFSTGIHPSLKPSSSVPSDAVKIKSKHMGSLLDYSVSLWSATRQRVAWIATQPVMIAEMSPYISRRNVLAPPDEKEKKKMANTRVYLCPEPLKISSLPTGIAGPCFLWSAIVHRLESYMVALEGCAVVGVQCSPAHALAAFTKDSDNSGDHGPDVQRINFRSGMGENYERLEFLGDTFLKMATSISTFIIYPNAQEFESHVQRMLMLCNKNLYTVAISEDFKLYEYVRSKAFSRRLWYPEGLTLLRGTGVKIGQAKAMFHDDQSHDLNHKSIADVSEALIGAAFLHDNNIGAWSTDQWDNTVQVVAKLVRNDDHPMTRWNEYLQLYNRNLPKYQIEMATAVQQDLADRVALEHPYTFRYPRLLQSAFIHPSTPFIHERVPNYQRLEFLGDSLLDLAAVTHLFYNYPDKDPQWLTEHKMAIVNNRFLGAVCVNLGFHKHLRHSQATLEHQIRDYVMELQEARLKAEELRHMEPDRLLDYWITVADPPKCLPDIIEAYVGAIFIDSDFDYSVVQAFFDRHIGPSFRDMSLYDNYAACHPITRMTDILQNRLGCADFRIVTRAYPGGPDGREKSLAAVLMIHDRIIETTLTKGTSGRYARIRVAKQAVEFFKDMSLVTYRARWNCRCGRSEALEREREQHAARDMMMA